MSFSSFQLFLVITLSVIFGTIPPGDLQGGLSWSGEEHTGWYQLDLGDQLARVERQK